MKDNLIVTKLNDGTELRKAINPESTALYPAFVQNEYFSDFISTRGRFYNQSVVESKKICPIGWHVPSDDEWIILGTYLGGNDKAGGKLKNTTGWESPNTGATNESGFSALPRSCKIEKPHYKATDLDLPPLYVFNSWREAIWWSSDCSYWRLLYNSTSLFSSNGTKGYSSLYSIRCVKN